METLLLPIDFQRAESYHESLVFAAQRMENIGWFLCAKDLQEMAESLRNEIIAAGGKS